MMRGAAIVLLAVLGVVSEEVCDGSGCDETSYLQLQHQMNATKTSRLAQTRTVMGESLYWQGYGMQLWSYFIGILGHDDVTFGGVTAPARVGMNMIGNAPLGNMYQSVTTDAGILGLLPGCFSGQCRGKSDFDDLMTTMAQQGKIDRAFTMCFDDSAEGGGMLYLGKPSKLPATAQKIPMPPLDGNMAMYSPLASFNDHEDVQFYYNSKQIGTQKAKDWNYYMGQGYGFSDTGTPGFMMAPSLWSAVVEGLKQAISADASCQRVWGYSLQSLSGYYASDVTVSKAAADCATQYLGDFVVKLGPDSSFSVSKKSFFYETEPCSGKFKISWGSSGGDYMLLGTSFNYGKTILYDTSDLSKPQLVMLGSADGCKVNYGAANTKPIPMKGVAGQVLGMDGTITAQLSIGTPAQTVDVQLDTGSQKLMGIHQACRNLGDCFLVQPEGGGRVSVFQGPDYHTSQCQEQIGTMDRILSQENCQGGGDGRMLCSCSSQEECMKLVLKTAAENLVPNKICAITRKMCGAQVSFHPEYSSSFSPKNLPSYAFKKPPAKQKLEAQCHLTYLCDEGSDASAGPARRKRGGGGRGGGRGGGSDYDYDWGSSA